MHPINNNNALSNHHAFVVGMSGSGKTTQGFKIAYRPDEPSVGDFDNYCRVIWAAGNGRHKKALKTINEEVAEYGSTGAGKAIIDNCEYACIMMQKTPKSAKYLDELTGVPFNEIAALRKFDYILQQGKEYTTGKIRW